MSSKASDTKHYAVIGRLGMQYNILEASLGLLSTQVLPLRREAAQLLYSKLHNRDRVDILRAVIETDPDQDVKASLEHALRDYDICTANRNIILHAMNDAIDEATETLTVVKKSSGNPFKNVYFELPLPLLVGLLSDMVAITNFVLDLHRFLQVRHTDEAILKLMGIEPLPLPEIPSPPHMLTPRQLEAGQTSS